MDDLLPVIVSEQSERSNLKRCLICSIDYISSSGCSAAWFSAPASGAGGRGFKSRHPDQNEGFEADPNASGEGRMSGANVSEEIPTILSNAPKENEIGQ